VTPPTIDGRFESGEWSNPQLVMRPPTYPLAADAYFSNDASLLYVMVDVVGDETDEVVAGQHCTLADESLLVFNFERPVIVRTVGVKGDKTKGEAGFDGIIGFDSSPTNPRNHKLFEFSIPLTTIRATPGQSIDFSSPAGGQMNIVKGEYICQGQASIAYDATTKKDNIWPLGLEALSLYTWGILVIQQAAQATSTSAQLTSASSAPSYTTIQTSTAVQTTVATQPLIETPTSSVLSATGVAPNYLILGLAIVLVVAFSSAAMMIRKRKNR